MNPIDIACRYCLAQAGQPCDWSKRSFSGSPPEWHSERIEDAAGMGQEVPDDVAERIVDEIF